MSANPYSVPVAQKPDDRQNVSAVRQFLSNPVWRFTALLTILFAISVCCGQRSDKKLSTSRGIYRTTESNWGVPPFVVLKSEGFTQDANGEPRKIPLSVTYIWINFCINLTWCAVASLIPCWFFHPVLKLPDPDS